MIKPLVVYEINSECNTEYYRHDYFRIWIPKNIQSKSGCSRADLPEIVSTKEDSILIWELKWLEIFKKKPFLQTTEKDGEMLIKPDILHLENICLQ